jgi:hypothetical protein
MSCFSTGFSPPRGKFAFRDFDAISEPSAPSHPILRSFLARLLATILVGKV